jgi:hypothetical protein
VAFLQARRDQFKKSLYASEQDRADIARRRAQSIFAKNACSGSSDMCHRFIARPRSLVFAVADKRSTDPLVTQ